MLILSELIMMRTRPLLAVLLCLLAVVVGCSNEGRYTEQTAAIDPALQSAEAEQIQTNATTHQADPTMPEQDSQPSYDPSLDMTTDHVELTDAQWRDILSEEEYYVLRRSGTELAGTGRYLDNDADEAGAYHCVGCGNRLYDARHKFHSGCGWPSFNQEVEPGAIVTIQDRSFGMLRTEMRCARCDGHLGHIFDDGFDQPTGLRHCVNGTSLIFVPQGANAADVIREHRRRYSER